MNIDATLEWFRIYTVYVTDWLFTTDRVIQYAIVVFSFIFAAYLSRYVRATIPAPESVLGRHYIKRFFHRLSRRTAFPVGLLILLGAGMLWHEYYQANHNILTRTSYLAVAWLLIRMGSTFISNPTISRTVSTIIWTVAALSLLDYLPLTINWLDNIKLDSAPGGLTVYDIIVSSLSVAAFVWAALSLSEIIDRSLKNKLGLSLSAQALLSKIFRFSLLAIAFLIGLYAVGIDLTAFAVFGGAMAVGIGLGLQKVFSNLIAGIILLSDNSIKPGDTIVSEGRYGKVNKLSARYISIVTRDGTKRVKRVGEKWARFQTETFANNSQPWYCLISPDEQLLNNPKGYTPDVKEYADFLQCGLDAYNDLGQLSDNAEIGQ